MQRSDTDGWRRVEGTRCGTGGWILAFELSSPAGRFPLATSASCPLLEALRVCPVDEFAPSHAPPRPPPTAALVRIQKGEVAEQLAQAALEELVVLHLQSDGQVRMSQQMQEGARGNVTWIAQRGGISAQAKRDCQARDSCSWRAREAGVPRKRVWHGHATLGAQALQSAARQLGELNAHARWLAGGAPCPAPPTHLDAAGLQKVAHVLRGAVVREKVEAGGLVEHPRQLVHLLFRVRAQHGRRCGTSGAGRTKGREGRACAGGCPPARASPRCVLAQHGRTCRGRRKGREATRDCSACPSATRSSAVPVQGRAQQGGEDVGGPSQGSRYEKWGMNSRHTYGPRAAARHNPRQQVGLQQRAHHAVVPALSRGAGAGAVAGQA